MEKIVTDATQTSGETTPLQQFLGVNKERKQEVPNAAIKVVQDNIYQKAVDDSAKKLQDAINKYHEIGKELSVSKKQGTEIFNDADEKVGVQRTKEQKEATKKLGERFNKAEKLINEALSMGDFSKLGGIK